MGVYPVGTEELGGMYTLYMFRYCLLTRIRMDCSSVRLSRGDCASVSSVVCVKGILLSMRVMRPPPCSPVRRERSRRIVVYPGMLYLVVVLVSLDSWIAATCMLFSFRNLLRSWNLDFTPFALNWSMLRFLMSAVGLVDVVRVFVGGGDGGWGVGLC